LALVIGSVNTLLNHVEDICPYQSRHTIQTLMFKFHSSVIELIRHRTAKIDCVLWRNCVRHTIDVENSFQTTQPYPEIIIHLNEEDDSDDELNDL
jgi:hypothetical protein